LIKLGIPYNSDSAVEIAGKVMNFVLEEATQASQKLARQRGPFPNFANSVYKKKEMPPLRNATLTTIAPTGSLSIIANCSSGIEPIFALTYIRKILDGENFLEINPDFKTVAERRGFYSNDLMKLIAENSSIQSMEEIPPDIRRVFITAHDVTPEWHVRMQAAFQKHTHNAVSKTINFPSWAKVEDVRRAYLLAYKMGCKGITIYRDKSREEQVLNVGKSGSKKEPDSAVEITPRPRPEVVVGTTTKVATGCGNLYITINEDDKGLPFEVFMQMGKAGGCAASQLEAVGRLVSLVFRSGVEMKSIIDQLRGIRCPSPSWEKGGRIFSCADAIAQVLEKRLLAREEKGSPQKTFGFRLSHFQEGVAKKTAKVGNVVGVCPDCGSALRHEEGCVLCHACAYTKC
jgi:ribonucleoside-diphosphate reductase alpha chain